MPRLCTVCSHKERDAIDAALATGDGNRRIAAQFSLSEASIRRHRSEHLPAAMLKAQEAKDMARSIDVMNELKRCFERVNLLFDACDRWLRDPEDPSRYEIGPRAEDVTVTYSELVDGKPVRRKGKLSQLLAKIERNGGTVEWVEVKHADPRELVLKTASQLQGQTELLAKLLGELDESPQVNIVMGAEWTKLRGLLLSALMPFPEARAAVAMQLVNMESTYGHSN